MACVEQKKLQQKAAVTRVENVGIEAKPNTKASIAAQRTIRSSKTNTNWSLPENQARMRALLAEFRRQRQRPGWVGAPEFCAERGER